MVGIFRKLHNLLKFHLILDHYVGIYPYEPYTSQKLQSACAPNTTHVVKSIEIPADFHYLYLSSAEVGRYSASIIER